MESTKHWHRLNLIERPPFYHLPRSRPVSFEKPTHLRCENNCKSTLSKEQSSKLAAPNEQQHRPANEMCSNATSCQMINQGLSNSSPKPYSKRETHEDWQVRAPSVARSTASSGCQCSLAKGNQQQVPRIVVGNQAYPTSTVHKSLFNSAKQASGESVRPQDDQQLRVHYSRLISPSNSTASCELSPPARQQHQQQQQQQQHRISPLHDHKGSTNNAQLGQGQPDHSGDRDIWASGKINSGRRQMDSPSRSRPVQYQREHDSNVVRPDSKLDEFMFTRQLERASIAHQTYRTLPIVTAKPKARHDLASGLYMNLTQDPTWELTQVRPSSANSANSHRLDRERKIQQALVGVNQPMQSQTGGPTDELGPIFNYREYIESTRRGY